MTRRRLRRTEDAPSVALAGRARVRGLCVAAVAALALVGIAELTGGLDSLERASVSTRFALRDVPAPTDIVIVKIDDRTFGELGKAWPFSRSLHAQMIDHLHAAGAREIVYDVQFTEPRPGNQDIDLYDAIGAAGGVTLATSQSDAQGHTNVLGGDANLALVHARAAAANLTTSEGGVITHYPYEVSHLKSLAVTAAEVAGGKPISSSRFPGGNALIDYRGGAGTFRSVPFWKVIRGKVPASVFRGKIVVVGATAPSLQDFHATPTSGSDLMPGPEVQANAIWTALRSNPLTAASGWLALLAILIGALLAPLAALRLGLIKATQIAVAAGVAYAVAAKLLFDGGVIIELTGPLAACTLGIAGMLAASYVAARSEGRVLGWAVRRRTEQLRDAQFEVITRLAQAAESRDGDTGDHIHRIGDLCERLALKVGFDPARANMLRHASALHDVGKIGIPDNVLLKPGALDADEWKIMQSHTAKGSEILAGSNSPLIQMAEAIARTHHERWDGTGYPGGLKGEEIPLEGRICAICDVYDALGAKRPYKDAWPMERILEEIAQGSGSHFDPALVRAFLELAPELGRVEPSEVRDDVDLDSLPPLFEPGVDAGDLDPESRAPLGRRSRT
jgi:CHASE2 domain-containing sensor protein